MIFSAMVMLDGSFALVVELLACPLLLLASSDRNFPGCLSGFADLDEDLSTLNPTLNGAGADDPGIDCVAAGDPEETGPCWVAVDTVPAVFWPSASWLDFLLAAPKDSPIRIGPAPFL